MKMCIRDRIADKEKSGSSWGKENPFLKDFPDLVFTTQPGGVFLPQYANAECSRIISIIEKKEIELAEKENREPRLYEVYPHKFRQDVYKRQIVYCLQESMISKK